MIRFTRVARVSLTAVGALGIALPAIAAAAAQPPVPLPPGSLEVTRLIDVSCTRDRVTVDVTNRGDTASVAVGLIGNGTSEAAQEGLEPGATLTLTGEPLALGESRSYQIRASFLDDQAVGTTLREFTATRPAAADCELPRTGAPLGVAAAGAATSLLVGAILLVGTRRRLSAL